MRHLHGFYSAAPRVNIANDPQAGAANIVNLHNESESSLTRQ
jgi:hypothetical protein